MRHPAALCLLALVATFPAFAQDAPSEAAPLVHRPAAKASVTAPQTSPGVPKPVPIHLGTAPATTGASAAKGPAPAKAANGSTGSTGTIPKAKPAAAATGATGTKPKSAAAATGTTGPKLAPPVAPRPTPVVSTNFNRNVIVLDPAHGGIDSGSRIGDSTLEKDVTLSLAFKLRSLLSARGFTVIMTRDADTAAQPNASGNPLTLDDRAGIANHQHPVACFLLHATGSGTGVHLYTSELEPTAAEAPTPPWLTAQAPWVVQSRKLAKSLATAFTRAHLPLVAADASVRPADSLACPAVVLELAPDDDSDASSINDSSYQQHVAEAVSTTLLFWKNQATPPEKLVPPPPPVTAPAGEQP